MTNPDATEKITPEWLRSNGFSGPVGSLGRQWSISGDGVALGLHPHAAGGWAAVIAVDDREDRLLPALLWTRDDVRRLCRELLAEGAF